jgi:hypothetical protein
MYRPVTGLPAQLNASQTLTSNPVVTGGLTRGAVGIQSDHAATLNVQRYIDAAGLVPIGAVITVALVANAPNAVSWNDGIPCGSVTVQVANSAGAVANLTNLTLLLAP